MTPEELRADVPALDEVAYMNFGASGPSPRRVVDAAESCLEHHEYEAPVAEGMYPAAFDLYDDVRERVAGFLGADADEIALTQSTTDGINRIAGAVEWEEGDVVVRTDLEHPAGILPWERLERRRDVEVRVVETDRGRIDVEEFHEAVAGAKLACFSALSWNYGTRLPVAELVDAAHEAGALALVDAVQVPGQAPLDVGEWGADAVAAAGHKWLLGTWGAGFLSVDRDADLEPGSVGYRGVEEPDSDDWQFQDGAARFEIGTTSPAPYAALAEAIDVCEELGVEAIENRIARLAGRLADGVPEDRLLSPAEPESGLVTIHVDDPEATVDRVKDAGIVIRDLPAPEAVRASVHAVNTEEDVDLLLGALDEEW